MKKLLLSLLLLPLISAQASFIIGGNLDVDTADSLYAEADGLKSTGQAAGRILESDGAGNISWEDPSAVVETDPFAIREDGTGVVTANIPFSGFKITGLGDPTLAQDGVTLVHLSGGTVTFTNKTFDADGVGNSITNIENADIKAAAAIALNKLAALTVSEVVVTDGSGFLTNVAGVTATEVGFLDATSSIQTQIDSKPASTAVLLLDGSQAMTGALIMAGFDITSVGTFSLESGGKTDQLKLVNDGSVQLDNGPLVLSQSIGNYTIKTTDAFTLTIQNQVVGPSNTLVLRSQANDGTDSVFFQVFADASRRFSFGYASGGIFQFGQSGGADTEIEFLMGGAAVFTMNSDDTLSFETGPKVTTTDATVTTYHILTTATASTYTLTSTCTAQSTASANAGYVLISNFKNVAGTVTQVGATDETPFEENAAMDVNHTISGVTILTEITGLVATTIDWRCGVKYVEAN